MKCDGVDGSGVSGVNGETLSGVDSPDSSGLVGRSRPHQGVTQLGNAYVPDPIPVTLNKKKINLKDQEYK